MASTASTSSNGPRYAPEDPTLPKPWKGLVDGNTGYMYFWNPETNVTQYERPTSLSGPLPPKSASVPISSSVQTQQSSGSSVQGKQQYKSNEENGRYNSSSSGPKLAAIPGAQNHQGARGSSSHLHSVPNGSVITSNGAASVYNHGPGRHTSRSSARVPGSSDMGGASSAESYRRHHEISVSGDDVPAPFMTFESTSFPSEILREVQDAGFSAPTPIQAQSWPIALRSRDIVAIAKTGSGKTLGYLVPGFIHLKRSRNNPQLGPTVLVLSPTRELATQIQVEAVKFGRSSRISCTCLYGGAPKGPQLRDLDRGTDIVVATPGRLNDILEMRRVSLRQVSYLVLDEADRMLDMGFEPQIRKIVKEIPAQRQTLMYTATWPKEVRKIAADLLVNPVQVNIGNIDELVANKSITQRRLEQILRSQEPGSKVIVFCSTKRMCDQLARTITRQFGAASIHGDKSQDERDRVLGQFRSGRSPILVATDVAARGLDIKDIRVVINYDFPTGIEDYVHRIGRTGRAGATGMAYTFFCEQDSKYGNDLIKVLEGADQRVPPELRGLASRGGGMGRIRRPWGSGSGGRNGGRSNGDVRNDSSGFGGRGGRGPSLSSGRLDRSQEGRGHNNHEPRDRYDRGFHDAHEVDARGRYDRGFPGDNNGRHIEDKSRGRSRSRSPSMNRGRGWGGRSKSRSRSRSRSWNHGHSRSRSRSRSRSFDRYGAEPPVRGHSPSPRRDVSSLSNKQVNRVCSPRDHHQQKGSPLREIVKPIHSMSPQMMRSGGSPFEEGQENFKRSVSPLQKHRESLQHEREGFVNEAAWQQRKPPLPYHGEEEEEGLIREDEEGMIPADDEDGRTSPGTALQVSHSPN
ncbi:ATP-dependent RNA helicase-like protein DB10 isoform X2 [Tasmannia lanceolata]|uniref:ATP-dependent RNA helicase-like protein DB10 isoform X2 n=1 Tax=Tasmannia lanceolata TaxID=3420 RepID=UPI004063B7B2